MHEDNKIWENLGISKNPVFWTLPIIIGISMLRVGFPGIIFYTYKSVD